MPASSPVSLVQDRLLEQLLLHLKMHYPNSLVEDICWDQACRDTFLALELKRITEKCRISLTPFEGMLTVGLSTEYLVGSMIGHGAEYRLKGDFERLPEVPREGYKSLILGIQSCFEASPNCEHISWLIQQKMPYSVTAKMQEGEAAAQVLDKHFRQRWHVVPVPQELQCREIDRILIQRDNCARRLLVEYKADSTASRTGNAFIEIESCFSTGVKRGWAESSCADFIVYFLPLDRQAMVIPTRLLRAALAGWRQTYQTKVVSSYDTTTGQQWQTSGLIVPLPVVRQIVARIIRV